MDDLHLYYFVMRRFPPPRAVWGKELDSYCQSMLRVYHIRVATQRDYEAFTENMLNGTN